VFRQWLRGPAVRGRDRAAAPKGRRSIADDRRRWNRYLAALLADRRLDEKVDTGFLDRMITDLRNPLMGAAGPRSETLVADEAPDGTARLGDIVDNCADGARVS
jgi:hypothetical protein